MRLKMSSVHYPSNKDLVPYSFMDRDDYCGPASAQMLLSFLLGEDGKDKWLQSKLVGLSKQAAKHSGPNEWFWQAFDTSPAELTQMLNKVLEEEKQELRFVWDCQESRNTKLEEPSDKKKAFQSSLATSLSGQCPVIIPVHSDSHWIVLYKCEAGSNKNRFIGRDPYYLKTGGDQKIPPVNITITGASGNFFFDPGKQRNTLVKIKPEGGESKRAPHVPTPLPISPVTPVAPLPPALPYIMREFTDYGFMNPHSARNDLTNKLASFPLLVKWMKWPDENYYFVVMQDSPATSPVPAPRRPARPKTYLLARFSASTGELLDALEIPPTEYLIGRDCKNSPLVSSAISKFPAGKQAMWGEAFRQELKKMDLPGKLAPNLVWKPCRQSYSAFYPFYEVYSPLDKATFYVRIDGEYFPALVANSDL